VEEPESAARASLFRSLVVYSVMLLGALAFMTWLATLGGAYIAMAIFGAIGLLIAYQVVQHYRDLREPLAESEGTLTRVWSRADLIIAWHSYYITVGRTVYRIQPEDYVPLEDRWKRLERLDPPQEMYVKVVHFPHTLNAVSIHEILRPPPEPEIELEPE
jgi:hypothetical protein